MKTETRTVILLMCAALALGSCTKKTITPDVDPQPAEVRFTASSQDAQVNSETNDPTPLAQHHHS